MSVKVSIIIPAWNAERFIEQTLASVLRQSYPHWELVVVDDGSTDGTVNIIEDYCERDRRVRLVMPGKIGRSAARNRGFSESDAESDYVVFLDSDDLWEDNALDLLVAVLDQNPYAVAAHGPIRQIDESGELIARGRPLPTSRLAIEGDGATVIASDAPTTFHVLARQCVIHTTGAILLRRKTLDAMELFSTALEGGEDWDLWLRISRLGDIAFVPQPVIRYRLHDTSMTHSDNQLLKAGYVAWKTLISTDNTPEQRNSALLAATSMLSNYLSSAELETVSRAINKRLRK
jgi:glycosyltransferase involved in cell wall biosynthesis